MKGRLDNNDGHKNGRTKSSLGTASRLRTVPERVAGVAERSQDQGEQGHDKLNQKDQLLPCSGN